MTYGWSTAFSPFEMEPNRKAMRTSEIRGESFGKDTTVCARIKYEWLPVEAMKVPAIIHGGLVVLISRSHLISLCPLSLLDDSVFSPDLPSLARTPRRPKPTGRHHSSCTALS